jgi:lipooligosaccharide transport system ATP-binding protein
VGVVPQLDNLDPDFTVEENLRVYARYFGIPAGRIGARIPSLLEFAGLAMRAQSRINTLSGGMKRRLTLARALVNDPDLIFLDEPTTGLDPQARHLIWGRLKQLLAERKTIFLTTHFMDEAERLCDRLSVLDNGRIVATGAPRDLIAEHIEPQVVEVYGDGVQAWAQQHGRTLAERCETSGETVFCYTRDAARLVQDLEARRELRYLHRHANLEDVFLKLTGRELRD